MLFYSCTPSVIPTAMPTVTPTAMPTTVPTAAPTVIPTAVPTALPTAIPTVIPTLTPTSATGAPRTMQPSMIPTKMPTGAPVTVQPSVIPTNMPTAAPSTMQPSMIPTTDPTYAPTSATALPSAIPTSLPSITPSAAASVTPTLPSNVSSSNPSGQPSRPPTSQPTIVNIVDANLLSVPLTAAVVKEKTEYYLGSFIAYFAAIYICLYLFSFTNYGKVTARKLYDASFKSQEYMHRSTHVSNDQNVSMPSIRNMYIKNQNLLIHADSDPFETLKSPTDSVRSRNLLDNIVLSEGECNYSKRFSEYLLQKRTLLGCEPCFYPFGYTLPLPSCIRQEPITLAPGRFESMVLYVCHNHPLFSCFYFMDGSKLGAHGHRILYIGKDVVVFVLYQFSNMILELGSLNQYGLGVFINLFIITPTAASVGLLLQYLYTCPFTENPSFKAKYAAYESTILFLGRLAIVPLLCVMVLALFFSCLFSVGHRIPFILINYFVFVQFYGILLTLLKSILLFTENYYYRFSFFGIVEILCIGNAFVERIVSEELVCNRDYACRVRWYLGIIKTEIILNRDDAIAAKWIEKPLGVATPNAMVSIEMKSDEICEDRPTRSDDVVQPVPVMKRESNPITFGNIYESNEDTKQSYVTASSLSLQSKEYATENQWRNLVTRNDDDLLYADYQKTQSCDNGTGDYSNSQSFEEWKLQRKEFKQGDYSLTHSCMRTHSLTHSCMRTHSLTHSRVYRNAWIFCQSISIV